MRRDSNSTGILFIAIIVAVFMGTYVFVAVGYLIVEALGWLPPPAVSLGV